MRRRLRRSLIGFGISLATVLAIAPIALATATMEYGEFVAQVQADKINQVAISPDRSKATAIQNGQSFIVNLPQDDGLIDLLTRNDVAITVQPPSEPSFWQRLFAALVAPIGLVSGFLLLVILTAILVTKKFMRR